MMCEHLRMDNLPFHSQLHCRDCGMSEKEIKLESKIAYMDKVCDELLALNSGLLAKAEELEKGLVAEKTIRLRAEKECKLLKTCANCRHFSRGYADNRCVKNLWPTETLRQNNCRDWKMV